MRDRWIHRNVGKDIAYTKQVETIAKQLSFSRISSSERRKLGKGGEGEWHIRYCKVKVRAAGHNLCTEV